MSDQTTENVAAVKAGYGAVAASTLSDRSHGVRAVAQAFGYDAADLDAIPAEANMGLSCGNPTAMASLRPGETVVDLGCGGGLDVFLAAGKVGPTGRAIGIDMTPEMIARATAGARSGGFGNVAFHLAPIDAIPLPDACADCVISNCVINLAPDKPAVFREIGRILKTGGRVALSDIALKNPLPKDLRSNIAAYVGCISGAVLIDVYRRQLEDAGFMDVTVVDSHADLNAYANVEGQSACCSPPMGESAGSLSRSLSVLGEPCCGGPAGASSSGVHAGITGLLEKYDLNSFAASVKVFAVKPR